MKPEKAMNLLLLIGCAYEVVALVTPLPTITAIIKRIGSLKLGKMLVWTWCGYVAWHFLEPDS